MYMVNVYLPEQSSLCLPSARVSVLGTVPGGVQLRAPPALGVWVPLARASSLALLAQPMHGGTDEDLHIWGSFLAFPTHLYGSQCVYTPLSQTKVHLHM